MYIYIEILIYIYIHIKYFKHFKSFKHFMVRDNRVRGVANSGPRQPKVDISGKPMHEPESDLCLPFPLPSLPSLPSLPHAFPQIQAV